MRAIEKQQADQENNPSKNGKPIDYESYKRDLETLEERLVYNLDERLWGKLHAITGRLVELKKTKQQTINHSTMILVGSSYLLARDYEVKVEYDLGPDIGLEPPSELVCDVYASKLKRSHGSEVNDKMIVEIETGFVPPEHALDPNNSERARIASKVYRYSQYAEKFFIGTPPHNVVYVPEIFLKQADKRTEKEIEHWNELSANYYKNPPLDFHNTKGHINGLYIINVDSGEIHSISVGKYMKKYPLFTKFSWPRF